MMNNDLYHETAVLQLTLLCLHGVFACRATILDFIGVMFWDRFSLYYFK